MSIATRLKFIREGMSVRRYHQKNTIVTDSVGKHSAGVAMFLVLMNDDLPSAALLAAALCHDLPECVVGDIPSPAKRAMSTAAQVALARTEQELLINNGLEYILAPEDWDQLKLADCFDGLMFCIEERRRGNTEICDIGDKYLEYIAQTDLTIAAHALEIEVTLQQWWSQANER